MEMKERMSTLARKVEELEGKRLHEVQAVTENPAQANPCINCQSTIHPEEHCPIDPLVRDLMSKHANVVGQYKPHPSAPYGNTYNSNWKNHPNLSWKPNPLLMCLLVPNNSLVPRLNHNYHHHLLLFNKLF